MEVKDKLETLQFVVTTHRAEFEKRRSFQWKAIFGVLALMGAIMAASVNEKTQTHIASMNATVVWSLLITMAVVGSIFLFFVHSANAYNKHIAHNAEKAMLSLLNGSEIDTLDLYGKPSKLKLTNMFRVGNGYWGWLFETIVLLFFAVSTAMVVNS